MDRPILVEKLLKCARREANVRRGKDRADDRDHLRASLDQWLRVLERDSPNGHYRDMERSPCTGDKFDLRTRRSRFDGRRKKAAECYGSVARRLRRFRLHFSRADRGQRSFRLGVMAASG